MSNLLPAPRTRDDSIPTRETLLRRCQEMKGEKGWPEFFEIYWPFLFRHALAKGLRKADAEDVAQQTLISVWANLAKYRHGENGARFRTWLIRILLNKIIDLQRKWNPAAPSAESGTGTAPLALLPDLSAAAPDAECDVEWAENLQRAARERVWKRLGQRDRQIYDYYEAHQRDVRQTAEHLNITVAYVRVVRFRVGRALTKEIEHLQKDLF